MPKSELALIKPLLLQWARTSINLDLETAAKRIGIASERLKRCENGEEHLTISQLRKAASVYKRPLAAFFLAGPPKGFSVPHDFRKVKDSEALPLSPDATMAIRMAHYRRELAIQLAEEKKDIPAQFMGSVSLQAAIQKQAGRVRDMLQLDLEEQKNWATEYDALNGWKNAIEHLGVLVFHFDGVDVQEIRAFSISEHPFPVISVNGTDSPYGRIFSLLHELGHLLLNEGGTCDFRESPARHDDRNRKVEIFCNQLAGETLVPTQDLMELNVVRQAVSGKQWTDEELGELSREYHVSTQVILRRLYTMGKVDRRFYDARQRELVLQGALGAGKKKGFLKWHRRVVRTVGKPFARIVLGAYYREDITSSDLAEYLGTRLKHLPNIEGLLSGHNTLTGGDR